MRPLDEEEKMEKFVGVLVSNKKHFGEVHVATCRDLAKGQFPTDAFSAPEEAQYATEGLGGRFENDEFVTDFPTIYAPCVKVATK